MTKLIKPALGIFVSVILIALMYGEFKNLQISKEIKEKVITTSDVVVETNNIVKEINIHTIPFSLDNDYHCLASNIYWESRNQPMIGKIAVVNVTLNRVKSNKYPDTICGVVTQTRFYPSGGIDLHSCQFSWYCDGLKDEPIETWGFSYEESFELAGKVLQTPPMDVTEGALYYHNREVNPIWTKDLDRVVVIEDHIFYRDKI
jgi:spore germination cell wall hydrolase CwlJ-like protein